MRLADRVGIPPVWWWCSGCAEIAVVVPKSWRRRFYLRKIHGGDLCQASR